MPVPGQQVQGFVPGERPVQGLQEQEPEPLETQTERQEQGWPVLEQPERSWREPERELQG